MTTLSHARLGLVRLSRALLAVLISHAVFCVGAMPTSAADRENMSVRWKRPVDQPQSLTISAGGLFYGGVGKDGTVWLFDGDGELLWKKQIEGATDVLIARNGQTSLVYSRLNPVHLHVYFFRKDGRLLWQHEIEGSAWSGAVSPDGEYAAVTTGGKYVYLYTPDPDKPRYRRWRLKGIGHCLAFTPDSKKLVVGTWQESTTACYDLDGNLEWMDPQDSDRQYELQISADGRRILGLRPSMQHSPLAELCLWDSQGKRLWRRDVEGFDVLARVSPRSQYVAVSYAKVLSHKTSEAVERRVAVYDSKGELLWGKGGLFFGPRLVALSPTGSSVIVSDGSRSLYNIGKRGRILSKHTLGGTIRRAVASEDGRRILLYCADGQLYLVDVG